MSFFLTALLKATVLLSIKIFSSGSSAEEAAIAEAVKLKLVGKLD